MYNVVKMVYQDGVLRSPEALPFKDRQEVLVLVLPLQTETTQSAANPKRAAQLREQAAIWLAQQPADAVRPPLATAEEDDRRLDDHFETSLAAIRRHAGRFDQREIEADIRLALAESRTLTAAEQRGLDVEVEAFLAEWTTHAH
jgi:hypothetical protein